MYRISYILILAVISFNLSAQILDIDGKIRIKDSTQGEGHILVSDSFGTARWSTKDRFLIDLHKDLEGGLIQLLEWGFDPLELWQNGVAYEDLIGLDLESDPYCGRGPEVVFLIDTGDIHPYAYVTCGGPYWTWSSWACPDSAIIGADSELFGDGPQNTLDVQEGCPSPPNPNNVFRQIRNSAPPNTSLEASIASVEEAEMIYDILISTGLYSLRISPGDLYWLSTEAQGPNEATHAMMLNGNDWNIISTHLMMRDVHLIRYFQH